MILTDYYKFARLATKSKLRLDCVASTKSYPMFEERRATKATSTTEKRDGTNVGDLVIYFGDVPNQFSGNAHRKADKSITIKGSNLSSVFVPDPTNNLAYGDAKGTADALLFIFHSLEVVNGTIHTGAEVEVFVASVAPITAARAAPLSLTTGGIAGSFMIQKIALTGASILSTRLGDQSLDLIALPLPLRMSSVTI